MPDKKRLIIGRSDKADFPDLELDEMDVKIDTGAYTSSIHCHDVEEDEDEAGVYIKFKLLDPSHEQYNEKAIKVRQYRIRKVRSSNGKSEKRYSFKTHIVLFGKSTTIELTLSERGKMRFPILLGRKFLNKRFLVDPSMTDLSYEIKTGVHPDKKARDKEN